MFRTFLLPFLCTMASLQAAEPSPAGKNAPPGPPVYNAAILRAVAAMPKDGGYATTGVATRLLSESVLVTADGLEVSPEHACPSYCSGATYLVFVRTLQDLMRQNQLKLSAEALNSLLIGRGQRDGEGLWGRWNANGPGTSRLFFELGLGRNFTDWTQARPGDFLKIFWNDEIGKRERGHSVIFTGLETDDGVEYVRFWSSNLPRGFSEKRVPRKSVVFAVFSRLERPANLAGATSLPKRDDYLAHLLTLRSTQAEVREMCGL